MPPGSWGGSPAGRGCEEVGEVVVGRGREEGRRGGVRVENGEGVRKRERKW